MGYTMLKNLGSFWPTLAPFYDWEKRFCTFPTSFCKLRNVIWAPFVNFYMVLLPVVGLKLVSE